MTESSLLAEVEREIDALDRLNKVTATSLAPHAEAVANLKEHVAAFFEDLRDDFLSETEDADAVDFLDALQNLFETHLGDDLTTTIEETCPDAAEDQKLGSKIHSELMRHVARLALS